MWSDNETIVDLIGFQTHAALIRKVVTEPALLPVVMGVFGGWGGGKSSVMRMLENELRSERYPDVVCLYFNGWMFEGYEDAKSALLTSILVQLGEHKRFGAKAKGAVVKMLKKVKWMEGTKIGLHLGVPVAAAWLTGSPHAAVPALVAMQTLGGAQAAGSPKVKTPKESKQSEEVNWADLIKTDPDHPDLLEMRKFRSDFQKMLEETDIQSLVVLVDDLDRCLPERLIETLEAIKLFVSVPRTAFVIAADPRVVRLAIATRYIASRFPEETQEKLETGRLANDYLEKLIQVPYHLPRLSPPEIETYINLLACQKYLPPADFKRVLAHRVANLAGNFYAAYGLPGIKESIGTSTALPAALEKQLAWSNSVAPVITDGLEGNPRQVKRMLNAIFLRSELAEVAKLTIRDDVLAKLMVLEYSNETLFRQLNTWQAAEGGFPSKLKSLESAYLKGEEGAVAEDDAGKEWKTPSAINWLKLQPSLGDIDLRDYFWLARDRTNSTLTGVAMVSPQVRKLFVALVGDNEGEQTIAAKTAAHLDVKSQESLLELLGQQVYRHPDQAEGTRAFLLMAEQKIPNSTEALLAAIQKVTPALLEPSIAFNINLLGKQNPSLENAVRTTLEYLAKQAGTRIAQAAAKALRT